MQAFYYFFFCDYLTGGNNHYDYIKRNIGTMTLKTIQRHMSKYTTNVVEGIIDVEGLKAYLEENGYPMAVSICEDGTRLTAATEYSYTDDSLTGLVAPFDENGMPVQNLFKATTPHKVMEDVKNYPTGNYAYVMLAVPLVAGAAPFVLYFACSDNKFTHVDVLNRWAYLEEVLSSVGIRIVSYNADGDPRLLKAMNIRACLDQERQPSPLGGYYIVNSNYAPNAQDATHGTNKFRNRLLTKDLIIGDYTIGKCHLTTLIKKYKKFQHGLTWSDINLKDKMKYAPTLKLIKQSLIDFLVANVEGSLGTAIFLKLMQLMHRSFIEENIEPLQRIYYIWTVNFFVRAWRNWIGLNRKHEHEHEHEHG